MRLRAAEPEDAARLEAIVRAAYAHHIERMGFVPPPVSQDFAAMVRTRNVTVARALLEHGEHEARRLGHDAIVLWTHESMAENIALYTRIGYAEHDRRGPLVYLRKRL